MDDLASQTEVSGTMTTTRQNNMQWRRQNRTET